VRIRINELAHPIASVIESLLQAGSVQYHTGVSKKAALFNKRRIELSNLEKVLFPGDGIIKAELVEYYLKVAPTLLRHTKRRALSMVRYPDGVDGPSFFQKNRPDWAPDWIEHLRLGEGDGAVDYILATEEAVFVWLANLACIELHQMHWSTLEPGKPDYIVYDLDPPEGYPFPRVVELALELRAHVESFGYHAFAKTSGGKGVHVVTPVLPRAGVDEVFEAASAVARPFVDAHSQTTTLQIKKDARRGKVLVDIYRNRTTQTIVAAYSVRGKPGAPVATPLDWNSLAQLSSPAEHDLRTVPRRLASEGDPWEAIGAYAVALHTERARTASAPSAGRSAAPAPAKSRPSSLDAYAAKRRFGKTPEPPPGPSTGEGDAFVIHRHHASRLHYDLRLERDGVLRSWAVPRGLPPRPGVKRLAVATEDHPFSYLTFEGTIPKGEYGGGSMWIYATGKYEITKDKKDGFYFRLRSPQLSAEYRMIHTREQEWLMERVDPVQIDWLRDPIEPMLAASEAEPPDSPGYLYEVKWDGIRAMVSFEEGVLAIRSRSQRDITRHFPELVAAAESFRAGTALFDGEIVCLRPDGRPVFEHTVQRLHHSSEGAVARAAARHPAVCYLFDCLYLDGRPIVAEPLERRREWLADAVKPNSTFRVSEALEDGRSLFRAASQAGLEGIVAKERGSPYLPGKRTPRWLKIKSRSTLECVVLGYTRGRGDRQARFGALHLGLRTAGDEWHYLGKVGTGFDERLLGAIHETVVRVPRAPRVFEPKPLDDEATVWIEPTLVCEVQYNAYTTEGTLRAAVFLRLRPDLEAADCRVEERTAG
jgi:DNA ligase D-like protein (predicted ligase)/DNA ligase D-like protein (predicted polymerase)/DNA ligase D-like protein (predicted 3'-phosphoesterase)